VRDETVARNYAETLFELAARYDEIERYGEGMVTLARLVDESAELRLFLETPRIGTDAKKAVIRKALGDALPRPLLNFLLVTIDKRRQRLLRTIALEYRKLEDRHRGRAHVEVAVAQEVDAATVAAIGEKLSALLGLRAIPHMKVRPEILGGTVVRVGDTVYDGSLRRRLGRMRAQLLRAELPTPGPAVASSD
jgi:F-type H+-transporting ATPase subunit delta